MITGLKPLPNASFGGGDLHTGAYQCVLGANNCVERSRPQRKSLLMSGAIYRDGVSIGVNIIKNIDYIN